MIVTNDYKLSSNINEVIRTVFFFHNKTQNCLQRTKIKKIRTKNI